MTEKRPEAPAPAQPLSEAEAAFQRGLIERGEAAVADEKGRLPPGAKGQHGDPAAAEPVQIFGDCR